MRKHELKKEYAELEQKREAINDDLAWVSDRLSEESRVLLLAERHRLGNRLQIIQGELDLIDGKPGLVLQSHEDEPTQTFCEGAE